VAGVAVPAGAHPGTDDQQLCIMFTSGISQNKAWSYIVQVH
jgi:hypothetical protein